MAFIPLTDEEKRILQNGGAGETEPPEKSAGGLFGGINVSSIPQVASARDRLADLRTEAVDAEADLSPAPAADLDSLARSGGIDLSPYEDEPFRGEERLNPAAPGSGMFVELSPEEKAVVAKEAPMAESTRFLAERFREAYNFGDPDAYAEDVKRASATGIPFHLVYNDNEMRQAADWQRSLERNLDGLSKLPPALVNWLRIPGRMELARDDIGTLAQLGELLRVEEYRKNTWEITKGYRAGTASMELGDIGTKAIFGQATEKDLMRADELRETLALNDRTKGTTGDKLVSGLGYTVGLRQEQFRTMADKALLYGAYGAGLAGLFGQAGPQVALPEELITVPAGFLFGARYGAALGALTKGFAMEAGNAYWEFKEIRDEEGNPLPEELIRVGAILYGIGSSGLEALQAGKLAKVVPGMGRLLTREGISTLLKTPTFRDAVMKFFKEYSGDLTFEVLTEGAQKGWQLVVGEFLKNEQNVRELGDALGVNSDDMYGWMQQAGGIVPDPEKLGFTGERGTFEPTTFAAAMDDVWKEVSEAIYSFALGLVPGAGINFLSNTLAVSRARDMQARFNTIAGLTQESRLAKRFPPAWREAVSALTKDGPVAEVGIDANVFYDTLNQEGLNPTEVALQLGVKAEDLEEARKNKTDIWVETGAYAEHVAGTELHDRLHQDIRVGGPEELTLREATAREKELRGQFNDAVEEASRALEASGADRAQLEEIKANVREQLLSLQAKWMKPNVAEGYATLWAHMAQQAAKRWGITPREWADRISLKIVDGEDGTKRLTATYDQQAGRFSATMDRDLLERAEQMWASGQDADAIWQATGWEMGPDGKWRYEISDADAAINTAWDLSGGTLGASIRDAGDIRLDQILEHPKIFAAYPLLRRLRVEYKKSMTDAIAAYDHDNRRILIGPDFLNLSDADAVSTLLHEIQHGIQVTEMFAQGGSPEMIGARSVLLRKEMEAARQDPAYQDARRQYADLFRRGRRGEVDPQAARDFWAKAEETVESVAEEKRLREELGRLGLLQYGETERTRFDAYRRLYGEAEARAAEIRRLMTDGERAAESFQATLKKMLVAEGLAAEDQDLTDATLVVNPGTEYELSIPWRGADPVRHDAGIADAVAAAIMDHEQGEANPDNILLPPDGQTLFQVQNLEEYGGTWEPQIRTWMEQNGFSEAQIHERLGAIRGQMAIFSALGPVQLELLPQGAGLNRGKGKGPIRKNSDLIYKITFDASAMCPKRLSAAATAFEVQKRIGRALTASERMALVALYKAAGKAAPCIYCYVEAPRGKSSEFVKVATDVVIGKTEPKKSWSKSSTDLAKLARTEYETLGMTPADIDPNVILDFEYAETAEARSKVEAAPAIYAFLLAQMLAAKANLPKLYEEYSGQILDLPDDLLKELNTYAGLRFFSSSDFQEAHIADLMQAFVDMSLRGATSHAYTKILEYVRIFGKTRQKIQTSIFAKEVDGQIVMDDWQGMDWAEAKKFRKEFPDVGTVLVGASDNIVAWALQQDWIDYIIPFHYSGLEKKYYSAMGWQDFTSTQREISIDDPKQGDHGIRMHETGSAAGITNAQGTRNYLKLAMERRLYPVFPAFIFKDGMEPVLGKNGKPLKDQRKAQTDRAKARWKEMVDKGKIDWKQINLNYYKLRKDYARTDTPFLPVQAVFDMGEAQAAFERFLNGEAPGAKIETGIADDLVRLIREHGEGVGEWALTEVNMGRPLGPSSMGWHGAGERSAAPTGMDILAQAISSANTSLRQVAATFKNKYFTPGDRNLDIGGGRFDYGTRFLGEKGVENLVFDPYNRSPEHNRAIIERLRGGERFPTVTVNNVLNVIAEQDVRENVVLQAAKSLEDGGTAYFLIHEGDGGGQGRKTSKGWQNNRKAEQYMAEVETHFSDVQRKGNLILAKSPVNIEGPAAWDASPDTADRTFFQDSIDTDYLAAVEAGDMETAQRMVDEAAREAGFTYHRYTTGAPARDVPWMMFTSDQQSVENAYGDRHYVASDQGAIDIEELIPDITDALEEYGSTEFIRDNAEAIADELNPDEIVTSAGSWDDADVVQDVWDRVLEDRGILKVKTTNGLIVMAEQDSDGNPLVKSADSIVKDDQGNVIPLSKRFDSKESDVRYRVSTADTLDAEYLAAMEAGDMESAQKLVDQAAREAGYGIGPVYHGTNAKFTTFDRDNVGTNYGKETPDHIGFFFTNRKDGDHPGGTAKDWARQSVEKKGGTPVVVGAYLKINNPFTLSDYAASIGDEIETIMTYAGDRQPVVDIFDNDSQYILNKAMEMGKDGIVFVDAFEGDSDGLYVAFEPEQIKSADPIVKDDKGNVIPLSERFDSKKPDIRYQTSAADILDAEYLAAVEAGDEAAARQLVDEAAKEAGFTVQHVFHGSKRIDRLGNELKPERATSGPMPFFTDDPTIAENYSKNKADTSIEIPESYTGWFKVAVGRGKPKTIDQAWLYLSLDKRRELAAKLPHVVNVDPDGNFDQGFRLTDDEYGMTNKSHWDFVLREKRGNVLAAAVEIWLDSGELFDQEEKFLEILRVAGLDGVTYDSPWLEQPGVLEAHLAIRTPFDTSAISDDDFAALEAASKGKRGSANVVDEWDKRRFSGKEWIALLEQDRKDGTSFAWTSIPDWVSRELHRMGYDGIKDQGGKYTGEGHTVWIPFFPWQVKRADAITRDDQGNVIPLSQRFDTGTPDIRYQRGGKRQPRGSITLQREWGAQEETVLTLTPNADKSTFLHEIGHLFLWDLEQLEKSGLADEKTLEDLEALRAWWSDHVSDLAIWIRKQKSFPQELRDRLTGPGWEQRIQEAIRGRGDADVVKAVQVATQEYWARGIEAYLMEGVAPNTQLERLFAQFRTWLTGIYRALQGVPDVQLSDEVRAVMDRMVASEDAIEMARLKRESDKAARAMLAEGVADREAEQYRAAAEQAAARAKTRLLKVLMGELQEDHKKKIETARADAEKRILPELLRLPHYRVYDRLRQWTHETGEWLSSAGLTEDQMDMVPEGLMTPEGGIDREVAADLLGLESEAELMALLAEARMRPLDQVLAEMVDAEVAPLESAMNNPELLQEQAEEALMGADRIRLLSLEREILQKKISKIEGITTQDSRTMAARAAAMTEQARDMFRGRTMRDAGAAARYMAEARRAGRQAFEAALAGRLEDALEAKDREMLFSALYLESKKLQEEREKNLRYLRKFWTGRQRLKPLVGEENLAQIQRILERYGFQQELPVEGRVPLGKWLGAANAQLGADLEETGVGIPVPDWMVAEDYRDERRSWKDLTVEEFGDLHKAVKAIEHFGRTQGRLVAQEKQQNLQAWKDKLQANVVKVWGKLKPGSIDPNYEGAPSVSRFLAAHDRIEFLLRRLDGFEDLGPAWQLLFQPVVTAERSEIARMRSAKGAIESIFSSYTAEERAEMRKKKYTTAQLDPQTQKPLVLSKENLLAMLLNWGARENREEVVFGYGFDRTVFNRGQGRIHYADMEQYYEAFHRGEREVEALFAQVLTEKDYQIAQAVWDHNETYWDEVSAMVRDLTGVTPERVERLPVKSPSGTIYSGGYYHLAFKPESNIKTFALSEKAAITALYEPQGMFAMTRTGHTKARHHGQRGSRLLRLDLGVEVEHLRDVVHDLYFRPVVRDLNRLINDEQVQNIILSTLGFEAFRQLKPWVHGLATAYRPMDNYGEKVFRKLMGNTSAAILGWSMSSALNQTLGWFTVIPALGLKRTVRGIMDFYLHPTTWAEKKNFAFGKSEYLRDRVNTFDRDVKAAIEQVTESPVRGKWSAVQESFFLAAGWMDMGVSLPAWLAGYDAGMLKFDGDEAKAVEYADWIVRSTQNTGAAKDLSSIQRGGPLWKSLTMFYTAFNSIYNQSREQWFRGHGREDLPRLAAYLVFQFVMPALLGDMMNRRGPDWDDDDPEDIWKWIFTSVLQYGSSQFIGLRDVVNAATSGFDYRMSPMADAGQSLARLMTGVGKVGSAALFGTEMPDLEQLGYRALDAAGTIWGIPSKQLQRTTRGLVGLADDPDWSPVDLLLRKPRK